MIVRTTFTAMPGVCVIPLDAGAGEVIGMSPASATPDRMQVKAIAITRRFMDSSPLNLRMQELGLQTQNRAVSGSSCKVSQTGLISCRYCTISFTHGEGVRGVAVGEDGNALFVL